MLQKRKDFVLNTFKRNHVFGLGNLALRYLEQNKTKDKVSYSPTALQIEVTTSCNLQCTMCEHTFMQKMGGHLKFSEFKKLIDQNPNIQVINLTGIGEALLNPEFIQMIKYAKQKGVYVWFNDNFTLMNKEKAEKMIELGADYIIMSLDGATKKTYEKIRVGAKFDTVINNFKQLRELRDGKNLSTPKLGINSVVLKENVHEIEDMVKLSKELKAENLMFISIVMSTNTGKLSLFGVDSKKIKPLVEKAKETAKELGVNVFSWPAIEFNKTQKNACIYPWVNPYIGFNGDVIPCCFIPQMANARMEKENIMGNVLEQSLNEIWNGKKYVEFRKKMKSDNPPKACKTCSKFYGQ